MMEIGLLEAEISLILSFKYDRKSAILKMAAHMSLHHFQHVYPRKYTCRPSLDHRSTVKLRDPQNFYGSIGWVLDHHTFDAICTAGLFGTCNFVDCSACLESQSRCILV